MTPELRTDDSAGCRQPGTSPEWWHDEARTPGEVTRARNICRGVGGKPACPFLEPCLEWALHRLESGIWGGCTGNQRRDIRKARGIAVERPKVAERVVVHGASSGVWAHQKKHEAMCRPCLEYKRSSSRDYQRKRRAS